VVDEEVILPISRDFLNEKGFSEEDRNGKYSDENFINLLVNRVRCLDPACDHYFDFRPGAWGTSEGKCWSCNREYVIHDDEHMRVVIDHGPMAVAVENPDNNEGGGILLVGSTGEGWALADYMEWIGEDYEIGSIEEYVSV
jgi:hypothetical protein